MVLASDGDSFLLLITWQWYRYRNRALFISYYIITLCIKVKQTVSIYLCTFIDLFYSYWCRQNANTWEKECPVKPLQVPDCCHYPDLLAPPAGDASDIQYGGPTSMGQHDPRRGIRPLPEPDSGQAQGQI